LVGRSGALGRPHRSVLPFGNAPRMRNAKAPILVRRFAVSHLTDVVYGIEPMTTELAEVIRILRRDHGVDYARLGFYLCESNPDSGGSLGLGKALTDLAAMRLNDHDPAWA
jgi:hypothetical protein